MSILVSTATDTSSNVPSTGAAAQGLISTNYAIGYRMVNLPYSCTDLASTNPAVYGRMVAIGARLTYTGTVMNASGTIYAYVPRDHTDVSNYSIVDLSAKKACVVTNVTPGVESTLHIFPKLANESDWQIYGNPGISTTRGMVPYPFSHGTAWSGVTTFPPNSSTMGNPVGIFMATGVAGQTFMLEVKSHCEYGGSQAQAMFTESHIDPDGFGIVTQLVNNIAELAPANPTATKKSLIPKAAMKLVEQRAPVALDHLLGVPTGTTKGAYDLGRSVFKKVKKMF
jgi:hypothetical protein